jgi:Fe-S oxidoreductase
MGRSSGIDARSGEPAPLSGGRAGSRPRLLQLLAAVTEGCSACGVCAQECGFLDTHGVPRDIASSYDPGIPDHLVLPYQCSLCSLCDAVCPSGVEPQSLFLEMRREAVDRGAAPLRAHGGAIGYERMGTSRLLTWFGLPKGCDTVLFPGCALPGTRPDTTLAVFQKLRETIPSMGIVLDCCTKPSYDLGREKHFSEMFQRLTGKLAARGVKRVLVACPNCWKVFTEHAPGIDVATVYEVLGEQSEVPGTTGSDAGASSAVTIHDPCVLRFGAGPQEAVRKLVRSAGSRIEEMPHSGTTTLCCGEGGSVGAVSPSLVSAWGERRGGETGGRHVVTYCAGCASHLSARMRVSHILDIVVDPTRAFSGESRVSRGWATYWNRFRLKARLQKMLGDTDG